MDKPNVKTILLILGAILLAASLLTAWFSYTAVKNKREYEEFAKAQNEAREKRENATREKLMPVGDVNLRLSTDYGKIKSLLKDKGEVVRSNYNNAQEVKWYDNTITATFLGNVFTSNSNVPADDSRNDHYTDST